MWYVLTYIHIGTSTPFHHSGTWYTVYDNIIAYRSQIHHILIVWLFHIVRPFVVSSPSPYHRSNFRLLVTSPPFLSDQLVIAEEVHNESGFVSEPTEDRRQYAHSFSLQFVS